MPANSNMSTRSTRLMLWFGRLSKIDKLFFVILFLRILYALVGTAGFELPGAGIVGFLFLILCLVFLIRWLPRFIRILLWRVRHRLLVTWIFVGVVPIVLFCALVAQGLFFLMGQLAGYMTSQEIARHSESVRSTAYALAWNLNHRTSSVSLPMLTEAFVGQTSEREHGEFGAIVHTGANVFAVPPSGPIREIPNWSKPDFVGLVKDGANYYFGAHVLLAEATGKTEVFLYQRPAPDFFANLLPGVATIVPDQGRATAGGIDIQKTERRRSRISFSSRRPDDPDPNIRRLDPPAGRGWWDFAVRWVVLMPTTDLTTGKSDRTLTVVASRPSLITKKLFSTLGDAAGIAFVLMAITAIGLLIVEIISVLFGAKLTRSITRAVADLYDGTQKVQAGDFSHRIPIRKNKDQLSELAGSFNTMTERVQDLIVEVKEKERLESELEIAHDVQSQLFPKELPRLETLELWGGCQPARSVSGDYYDFISLGPHQAALAIGDISGKGISAALLMAHIQSALRSQFMERKNGAQTVGNGVSPSHILSILNNHLYTSSAPEKYATFFLGLYTDENSQLIYTNAGHLAPMLVRGRNVSRLPGEGFPVGLFPGVPYDQQILSMKSGDLLAAFTDGITETPNNRGDEFGDQRLADLLVRNAEKSLEDIAQQIRTSVAEWTGDLERHDDTTLVLARRL